MRAQVDYGHGYGDECDVSIGTGNRTENERKSLFLLSEIISE